MTYTDADGTLAFAWEMASCGFELVVPTADQWEAQTGRPLAGRLDRIIAKRGNRRSRFEVVEGPSAVLQVLL